MSVVVEVVVSPQSQSKSVEFKPIQAQELEAMSIATLTDEQVMKLGKDAGARAFQAAIEAAVPTPLKAGDEIISVIRSPK